jgi:hypothetical protein
MFLETNDTSIAERVSGTVENLAEALGLRIVEFGPIRKGSFFRDFWVRLKSDESHRAVADRMKVGERFLEAHYIGLKQAEIDSKTATAFRETMESIADVPHCCIRIGSLLILKYANTRGEAVVQCRQLSQPEIWAMERHPELQSTPSKVLEALAMLIETVIPDSPDQLAAGDK